MCQSGACATPSCGDGTLNGSETDVDCGGSCPGCAPGGHCVLGSDCVSLSCNVTCQAPTCADGIQNGGESSTDCGGSTQCSRCNPGQACGVPADCASSVCTNSVCQGPTCTDSVQNGSETDVDCGGSSCQPCSIGQKCGGNVDCTTGLCMGGVCAQTCGDGVKDGSETDVDCGGGSCPRCADGRKCAVTGDCTSSNCQSGVCCTSGSNRDGDSLDDCTEYTDGNAWTDPDIFNGLNGNVLPMCSKSASSLSCTQQDTVAEVRACAALGATQKMSQWAGWSWPSTSDPNLCSSAHGFSPNWTQSCSTKTWAVYYTGVMNLGIAGKYCFRMAATTTSNASCGTLVVNGDSGTPIVVTDGGSAVCLTAASAQTAKLEFYYQQTNGVTPTSAYSFDALWCYAPFGTCDPSKTGVGRTFSPQVLRKQ